MLPLVGSTCSISYSVHDLCASSGPQARLLPCPCQRGSACLFTSDARDPSSHQGGFAGGDAACLLRTRDHVQRDPVLHAAGEGHQLLSSWDTLLATGEGRRWHAGWSYQLRPSSAPAAGLHALKFASNLGKTPLVHPVEVHLRHQTTPAPNDNFDALESGPALCHPQQRCTLPQRYA